MKKFLLLAGVACLFAANAQAEVSQYVSGKISYDFNKIKVKSNFMPTQKMDKNTFASHVAYGARAGYVRGEIELNDSLNIKKKIQGINTKLYKHSLMANAYFDYLTCTPWTPYVGAGIGAAYLKYNVARGAEKKTVYNFAWQVMGGVTYDINSNWALDAGYRYADLGQIRKNRDGHTAKFKVRDHEILLGARYTF